LSDVSTTVGSVIVSNFYLNVNLSEASTPSFESDFESDLALALGVDASRIELIGLIEGTSKTVTSLTFIILPPALASSTEADTRTLLADLVNQLANSTSPLYVQFGNSVDPQTASVLTAEKNCQGGTRVNANMPCIVGDAPDTQENNMVGKIVGPVVAVVAVMMAAAGVAVYLRKRRKVQNEGSTKELKEDTESDHNNSKYQ